MAKVKATIKSEGKEPKIEKPEGDEVYVPMAASEPTVWDRLEALEIR